MTLLSAVYAAVARARRRSFERHPERQRRLRQPVVSIGNLAVGGSGKTPAVAHVARLLVAEGERPAILTRGYRRRQPTEGVLVVSDGARICADVDRAGDEPLMLARALPGVAVLVGADRYLSGLLAERRFGCTVHVLDDGFQHVRLRRDADIVLILPDDLRDRVLPAGRLREAPSTLARAGAIVVNAEGDVDTGAIARQAGVANVFRATTRLGEPYLANPPALTPRPCSGSLSDVEGSERERVEGKRVVALAGIARPRRFFDLLPASGFQIVREMAFPDHYRYTARDMERVLSRATESGAEAVLTTEKDMIRLLAFRPFPLPFAAVPLEFGIEPRPAFEEWLAARLAARRSAPLEQPA